MLEFIVSVVVGLPFIYWSYRSAKRRGAWAWSRFFGLIGVILIFFCVFVYPVLSSGLTDKHPKLTTWVLFGGVLVFMGVIRHLFVKRPVR